MACCNLPLGARWPVVTLVLAMNALGASSPAVSRRPTPQTGVPVWAVLLSHVPGQTVYLRADQPLVLAWRLDLDAVQAEMQRSGMDDGVRADDLEFGLVVDGELATLPGRPGSGGRDQLLFWLLEKTWGMESGTLSLQLVINGPDGPIGRATEQVQLVVRVWWSEFHGAQGAGQNALKPKCAAPIRLHHALSISEGSSLRAQHSPGCSGAPCRTPSHSTLPPPHLRPHQDTLPTIQKFQP